jgi:hypothetical protein
VKESQKLWRFPLPRSRGTTRPAVPLAVKCSACVGILGAISSQELQLGRSSDRLIRMDKSYHTMALNIYYVVDDGKISLLHYHTAKFWFS